MYRSSGVRGGGAGSYDERILLASLLLCSKSKSFKSSCKSLDGIISGTVIIKHNVRHIDGPSVSK